MDRYEKAENIKHFFELLNQKNIHYILIKNIGKELPKKLPISKDIDILIDENEKKKFHGIMKKIGRQCYHPYCRQKGWENLYGLPQFEMWRLFSGDNLFVDVTYKLCCKSLTPMKWIPLDDTVQKYAWKHKVYDEDQGWWILDKNTSLVYYLIRCVFDKAVFSEKYIKEIEAVLPEVDENIIIELLNPIFFGFTLVLLEMVKSKKYMEIREHYIAFDKY